MKHLSFIIIVVFASATAQAQDEAISSFFEKYSNDESFTLINISSKMFSLFTNLEVEDKEDQEVLDAISKLKGLRILGKDETRDSRKLYSELVTLLTKKKYEELMSVREKDSDIKFFIEETSKGKISELVMVLGGNDNFMALSLFGEIDLKQVVRISKSLEIEGMEKLQKLDEKKD